MSQSHDIGHETHHFQHQPPSMNDNHTHNRHNHINILINNNNFYVKQQRRVFIREFKGDKRNKRRKMLIWKWIKFRDKSGKPFKEKTEKVQAIKESGTAQNTTKDRIKGWKKGLVSTSIIRVPKFFEQVKLHLTMNNKRQETSHISPGWNWIIY